MSTAPAAALFNDNAQRLDEHVQGVIRVIPPDNDGEFWAMRDQFRDLDAVRRNE